MLPQKIDTKKLFYKRWLYKIVVTCGGINHLHRRGMEYVANIIPQSSMWNGKSHYTKTVSDHKVNLLEIGAFLETALKDKQYQIRAESSNAAIFTNDETLVNTIANGLPSYVTEIHKPKNLDEAKFLQSNKSKIICEMLPHDKYRYKIYFKNGHAPSEQARHSFLSWSDKFDDGRILVPEGTRKILNDERHPYFYGQYFYAKDSKMASMALMIMGDYLNKTEEFVLKSEIT